MLDSAGGFTFCLVPWDGDSDVPRPVVLDGGGASRADQLCLDIPPEAFDAECRFWQALTGWHLHPGSLPEFAYLDRPAGMPVRLLFQRRAVAGPQDQVTAHVDVACQDVDRLTDVHVAAGARVVGAFHYWTTLADPIGRQYCLTRRDPDTGRLPASGYRTSMDA